MKRRQRFGDAVFSRHAIAQMHRRGITEVEVRAALAHSEKVQPVSKGRVVVQAMDQQGLLLRVFIDVAVHPPVIVTVYRTSKIAKYRDG